jgi:hydroxylysine kinase
MHLLQHTPRFSAEQARALAREHYGLDAASVSALPSERDQNFLLQTPRGERFVLKLSNAREEPAFLGAQHQVLDRLARQEFCPRVVPGRSGAPTLSATTPAGTRHLVRLVTWLPGVPMGRLRHHPPELLRDLGRCLGVMDRALAGFDHPACHRDFHWDLCHGTRGVAVYYTPGLQQAGRRVIEQELRGQYNRPCGER